MNNKTRNDILLITALMVAAAGILISVKLFAKSGSYVQVSVDGEAYAAYPLGEDTTAEITTPYGTNVLVVQNGKAYISEADCPDKLCVHFAAISKDAQSIICLPHKLVVEVRSGETDGLDGVVN